MTPAERQKAAMAKMRRPMPADFPIRAAAMLNNDLERHYSAGYQTIIRWRQECGVAAPVIKTQRAPKFSRPDDFALVARSMTLTEAERHYDRPATTIRRWFAEVGIEPRRHVWKPTKPVIRAELDQNVHSLAAHHLRRFYPSVHRADIRLREHDRDTWGDERGLPDRGKGLYFVSGLGVIPAYEMIAIARDHGFAEAA